MRIFFLGCLTLAGITIATAVAQEDAAYRLLRRNSAFPGVTFSEEQKQAADALAKEYAPKLNEQQKAWEAILSDEQKRAGAAAVRKARADGKRGRELQDAYTAATKPTDEQIAQQQITRTARNAVTLDFRNKLIALLTEEQKKKVRPERGPRGSAPKPTHANMQYGDHKRHVMDVWLADSKTPTPVLVSIHGGGFRGGNKSVAPDLLKQCLEAKISVVAITYRLTNVAIAPAQHHDAARAIQFIRHNARKWNLDGKRLACKGGSAGAGISLWLAFHEDLADPDNADKVLRESTRITCAAVFNGQTSYDPRFIRELFPDTNTYQHEALSLLYDVDLSKLNDLPKTKVELFEEVSALPHLTKDDPPVQLNYASKLETPISSQGVGIHHPRFGKVLKEKMDALKITCQLNTGATRTGGVFEFIKKQFGVH